MHIFRSGQMFRCMNAHLNQDSKSLSKYPEYRPLPVCKIFRASRFNPKTFKHPSIDTWLSFKFQKGSHDALFEIFSIFAIDKPWTRKVKSAMLISCQWNKQTGWSAREYVACLAFEVRILCWAKAVTGFDGRTVGVGNPLSFSHCFTCEIKAGSFSA
jgi:hypothetical protein